VRPPKADHRDHARLTSETLQLIEKAEESAARGHPDTAREVLIELVDTVDRTSEVEPIRRCLGVAGRIGAHDLALHYALCLWCASPGRPHANRALLGAALFHPDRRVAGAAYRMCRHRARAIDWYAIAAADAYAKWPQITDLCRTGRDGSRTISQLRNAPLLRAIGGDGIGAWVLGPARVTRVGRSIALGVGDGMPSRSYAYVPALSLWDPSAALKWAESSPADAYERLGLLGTRFSYSGYWHWLMEGLLQAVRLDEAGLLKSVDRLVICLDGKKPGFITESLQAVGIDDGVVLATPDSFDWLARELVVPMRAPGFGGLIEDADPSDVREIKIQNAKYDSGPDIRAVRRRLGLEGAETRRGFRRLFISRRDATKRRVANEDALVTALKALRFEVVVPGTLTFTEQVATFASADVIVGPHGAGLANALFMPRGSTMLELHHANFGRPWYRRLAETLGLRYEALACDPDPTSPQQMLVAVDTATALVRSLLSTS
jgi:Glycosyltransferase 61